MSVFLRWGILGILSFAALLYAYNASKRMAAAHAQNAAANVKVPASDAAEPSVEEDEPATGSETEDDAPGEASPFCEVELLVARRAVDMRRQGVPRDRLLRIQEIAWQEPAERRERLEKVAILWFDYQEPISAEALRTEVIRECESTQAP